MTDHTEADELWGPVLCGVFLGLFLDGKMGALVYGLTFGAFSVALTFIAGYVQRRDRDRQ